MRSKRIEKAGEKHLSARSDFQHAAAAISLSD